MTIRQLRIQLSGIRIFVKHILEIRYTLETNNLDNIFLLRFCYWYIATSQTNFLILHKTKKLDESFERFLTLHNKALTMVNSLHNIIISHIQQYRKLKVTFEISSSLVAWSKVLSDVKIFESADGFTLTSWKEKSSKMVTHQQSHHQNKIKDNKHHVIMHFERESIWYLCCLKEESIIESTTG